MSPIRVAFIGLSAKSGWGKNAHWPYLKETSKYQVVGICNSSEESGKAAVEAFDLPKTVKVYGSSEELAADAESFDLAVCCVRVDKHYDAIRPVVAKSRACYVEWPLGKNLQQAQELYELARQTGIETVVGLQARQSPVVGKVKKLIARNDIGRILSSTVVASAGNLGQEEIERLGRMFNDSSIQANMLTIHFGHLVDYVLYALGDDFDTLSAITSTQRREVQLKMPDGSTEDCERDTPDHVLVIGHLRNGAVVNLHLRGGPPMKDTPGLRWRIYGEKGEIEVTSSGCFLQIGYDDMTIRLHEHGRDLVQTVDWDPADEFEKLSMPARNIARLYEAVEAAHRHDYADWSEAVGRHRLLEKIVESSEKKVAVKF